MLPTGEMLNLVSFGEKKVSETAEMLNMLNFLGSLELMRGGRGGPKKFDMFNISPAGSIFLSFQNTKFNISPVRSKF